MEGTWRDTAALDPAVMGEQDPRTVAVFDFDNVTGESACGWLATGIAETVTGDLRALGKFRVVDRSRVVESTRRTNGAPPGDGGGSARVLVRARRISADDGRIRITARLVDVSAREALADAKVDGPLSEIFALQDKSSVAFRAHSDWRRQRRRCGCRLWRR